MSSSFVDEAQIHVKAGDGGAGAVSFRREAHVSRGGPDGGDGGGGGDVWLVASTNQASLLGFRDHPHRRADSGVHGQGKQRHGAAGADLEVSVPVGTIVRGPSGSIVADLAEAGDRLLAAEGGRGGRGNARFLSNRRRAPAFAEQGEAGEESWLDLELKLLADVALVGFPNAGKSTLISRVSAARPKIADYPFTTLEPHLGVVRFGKAGSETEFVMADIPGLVEGAAEGRGLGHQFLRHVERARVLLVMLDLASADGRPPEAQERILLDELGRYRPELLERPRVTVGSKADVAVAPWTGGARLPVSAATGNGLDDLLRRLALAVDQARRAEPAPEGTAVVHRPVGDAVEVTRADDGSFVVLGRAALRAVALSDLTDDDALDYVQDRLRRLGVERALVRAGVREGDIVHLGGLTFSYHANDPALGAAGVAGAGPTPRRTASSRRSGRRRGAG
ncbi:MAG TPA: GTPase ObgE [Acidimicrobiales bacterium]|nr:GTPase ObgE [Acidimicrobiales bacterium]